MSRDCKRPIGRVAVSGYGIERTVDAVHWYLRYEGPQSVFMDDDGSVWAAVKGTATELRLLAQHSQWLVGSYEMGDVRSNTERLHRSYLIDDLRERLRELRELAA